MATTKLTPPILSRGLYTLRAPFTAKSNMMYTCSAIRSIPEMVSQGVDVLALVYTPVGLAASDYQTDIDANANIITLTSDYDTPIHVPDTYIASFPDQSSENYQYRVLAIPLGAIANGYDLTGLKANLSAVCSDVIGIEPAIVDAVAALTDAVTPEQAEALERARAAKIGNRETDRAKALRLETQNTALQQQCDTLIKILQANNLMPQ